MVRCALVLLLGVHVLGALVLSPVHASPATTAATLAGAGARPNRFTFDGSDDDEFDFDLDLSSKQKLKRFHEDLDGDDAAEIVAEAIPSIDGTTRSLDLSTKVMASGFNFGRGPRYVASRDVEEGEVLFSVPFMDVMNMESARLGRVKALLDANPDLPASIALAMHLLEEKFRSESSRFYNQIESMPGIAGLNGTLFYSDDEMEMIRGSNLYRTTVSRAQGVDSFYDALVGPVTSPAMDPPLFAPDEFTKENFAWALGTVWARAFSPTGLETDALIAPILDTIGACVDRDCPANRIEWDRMVQRLVVYATRDYVAGEEVLVSFGDSKPSTLLMLNHGFARSMPYTDAETFNLAIFLDPNDTLLSVKTHLLETHNMSIESSYTLRYRSKRLDVDLAKSLKLKLLSAAELVKYPMLLEPNPSMKELPVVSLRNEFVFSRAIVFACKNLLANYPTTLDHDRAQLNELEAHYRDRRPGVASTKLQILRTLVIEKEILSHALQLALEQWSDLLVHGDPSLFGI